MAQPVISLVPRTATNCLDLAVMYYGRHLAAVLGMVALVAAPAVGLTFALARWMDRGLLDALLVLYIATLALSVLLVNDTVGRMFAPDEAAPIEPAAPVETPRRHRGLFGPTLAAVLLGAGVGALAQNMGDALGMSDSVRRLAMFGGYGLAGLVLLVRAALSVAQHQRIGRAALGVLLAGLPLRAVLPLGVAIGLTTSSGWLRFFIFLGTAALALVLHSARAFAVERALLRRQGFGGSKSGKARLREASGAAFLQAVGMGWFVVTLWAIVFVSVDGLMTLVFRQPILFGRAFDSPEPWPRFWELLTGDPVVLAVLVAAGLLAWPVFRLAWLFYYLDIQVCEDCWDLQIRFAEEARRLA